MPSLVTGFPLNALAGGVGGTVSATLPAFSISATQMAVLCVYGDWGGDTFTAINLAGSGGTMTWTKLGATVSDPTIGTMSVWQGIPSAAMTGVTVKVTTVYSEHLYVAALVVDNCTQGVAATGAASQISSSSAASCTLNANFANSMVIGFGSTPFASGVRTFPAGNTAIDNSVAHSVTAGFNWIEYATVGTAAGSTTVATTAPSDAKWGMIAIEIPPAQAAGGGGGGGGGGAPLANVGVCTDVERMLPNYPPRAEQGISLSGAGNECLAFQIIVAGLTTGINVSAVTPTAFGVTVVPASNIFTFQVRNVHCTVPSGTSGFTGWVPDICVPDRDDVVGQRRNAYPFFVPVNELRSIWVDIHIPANATAGTYTANIAVVTDHGTAQVPVSLTIWPFNLPATSSFRSFFNLFYGALTAQHNIGGNQDAHDTMRSRYAQLALDHRMSVSGVDTGSRDVNRFNSFYGPFMNGTSPNDGASLGNILAGAKWTSVCGVAWGGGPDGDGGWYRGTSSDFLGNSSNNGWMSRVFDYTADEPPRHGDPSSIPSRYQYEKGINFQTRCLIVTDIGYANNNGITNDIDIIVPVLDQLITRGLTGTRGQYNQWLQGGSIPRELWTYVSCDSWGCGTNDQPAEATYAIDQLDNAGRATGLWSRAVAWNAFNLGCSGELYWDTCQNLQKSDPWGQSNNPGTYNTIGSGGNGDGCLYYPGCATFSPNGGGTPLIGGTDDIPLASLRMKMIRAGYQDLEYLKILKGLNDPLAGQLAFSMFPHPYQVPTKEVFYANRLQIGNRIATILGGGTTGGGNTTFSISNVTPSSGPTAGGTVVTITGVGFSTGCTVKFGSSVATTAPSPASTDTALFVIAPIGAAGVVDVTVVAPGGATATKTGAFTYIQGAVQPVGPSMDPGWPVTAQLTGITGTTLSVNVPATAGTARLIYATISWNTRGNANATPVSISGLGLTWFPIKTADFVGTTPGHIGAEIWAAWAADIVPAGGSVQATFGATVTADALLTVYARGGTPDGSTTLASAFGVSQAAADPSGASAAGTLTLSGITAGSGAVVAIADGGGSSGLTPIGGTAFDSQNKNFVSLASGQLVAPAPASMPIGANETLSFYAMAAAEILAGGKITPRIDTLAWSVTTSGFTPTVTSVSFNFFTVGYLPSVTATLETFTVDTAGFIMTRTLNVSGSGFASGLVVSDTSATVYTNNYVDSFTVRATRPDFIGNIQPWTITNPDGSYVTWSQNPVGSGPIVILGSGSTRLAVYTVIFITGAGFAPNAVVNGTLANGSVVSLNVTSNNGTTIVAQIPPQFQSGANGKLSPILVLNPDTSYVAFTVTAGPLNDVVSIASSQSTVSNIVTSLTINGGNFQAGCTATAKNTVTGVTVNANIRSNTGAQLVIDIPDIGLLENQVPVVTITNPNGQFADTTGASSTTTTSQPPTVTAVAQAATSSIATAGPPPLNLPRRLSKTPAQDDPTLNLVQDQFIRAVNPALDALSQMPVATNGVFASEDYNDPAFLNGWSDAATSGVHAGYLMDAVGVVTIDGDITGTSAGLPAFVLPPGFRPRSKQSRTCVVNGNALGVVVIDVDGSIIPISVGAGAQTALIFSLGGISFKAGQ